MTLVRRTLELEQFVEARRDCTVTESNSTDADATATASSQWWCQTLSVSVSVSSTVSVKYVASIQESGIGATSWGGVCSGGDGLDRSLSATLTCFWLWDVKDIFSRIRSVFFTNASNGLTQILNVFEKKGEKKVITDLCVVAWKKHMWFFRSKETRLIDIYVSYFTQELI